MLPASQSPSAKLRRRPSLCNGNGDPTFPSQAPPPLGKVFGATNNLVVFTEGTSYRPKSLCYFKESQPRPSLSCSFCAGNGDPSVPRPRTTSSRYVCGPTNTSATYLEVLLASQSPFATTNKVKLNKASLSSTYCPPAQQCGFIGIGSTWNYRDDGLASAPAFYEPPRVVSGNTTNAWTTIPGSGELLLFLTYLSLDSYHNNVSDFLMDLFIPSWLFFVFCSNLLDCASPLYPRILGTPS